MKDADRTKPSARERARKANAQRLIDARERLNQQESDLIAYFDATHDEAKIEDELSDKIEKLRNVAKSKLLQARGRRAAALSALKGRGETFSNIATLVDLSVPEVTKLVKSQQIPQTPDSSGHIDTSSTASPSIPIGGHEGEPQGSPSAPQSESSQPVV
ncbi:hypothetical protein U2G91_21240 [Rhodococcoides fascians]|uniref:hypothetical protein n=1 Tax=Rhodococcoides fascians TaxID=1828 RepID=UPI002ACE7D58|nr:hypothetical protein [Rhodococcus fascians]WQH27563.1 hypothetical protein U2G91_21240 [Rhodococcus fascians]